MLPHQIIKAINKDFPGTFWREGSTVRYFPWPNGDITVQCNARGSSKERTYDKNGTSVRQRPGPYYGLVTVDGHQLQDAKWEKYVVQPGDKDI